MNTAEAFDLPDFVRAMPKAELHVHHIGSASPRTVADLAARHPEAGVPSDVGLLSEYFKFTDFTHFLRVYKSVVDLVRDPEDLLVLTLGVARDMAAENIRYAEVTVSPYSTVSQGMPQVAFLEAITEARKVAERDLGVYLQWIFDIPSPDAAAAEMTLEMATAGAPEGLVGFGLGGPEVPRRPYQPYFERARAEGLHSVPHAGEVNGPEMIWDALNCLGAERIGHGTSCVKDARLLEHLAEHQIPLEVCVTSNVATGVVPHAEVHPLRTMVDSGLVVTINSDDPPMFSTTLSREYEVAARLLDLDAAGVTALAKAAVTASYAPSVVKKSVIDELDEHLRRWTERPL